MARFTSSRNATARIGSALSVIAAVGLSLALAIGAANAQTPAAPKTPKTPETPEPPKSQFDETQIRELERQIEESTKKLEAAREAAEASIDSMESMLDHASDERVEIGGSIVVEKDEVITGDVVAVGGSVDVYGQVMGDAVAVGGRVYAHDGATIMGDAVSVGGRVEVDEGAKVMGERVSVAIGLPGFRLGLKKEIGDFDRPPFFGFIAKIVWIAATLLLSIVFFAIAGSRIDVVSRRVEAQPGQSFLIGFLGAFATPIGIAVTAVLLVVTIIGIFLLPVLVLLVILTFAGGFLGVALAVGRRLVAWRDRSAALAPAHGSYTYLIVGYLALHALVILGMFIGLIPGISVVSGMLKAFGVFTIIFAFFVGYGALLLSNFGTRTGTATPFGGPPPSVPPIPPVPPAPPSPPLSSSSIA
jgi:hypothetical protein